MGVAANRVVFAITMYDMHLNSKCDTTHVRPATGSHGAAGFLVNHRTVQLQGNRVVRIMGM
jgi:hypothetical protein